MDDGLELTVPYATHAVRIRTRPLLSIRPHSVLLNSQEQHVPISQATFMGPLPLMRMFITNTRTVPEFTMYVGYSCDCSRRIIVAKLLRR